jgi:hypothetical protein
MEYSLTQEHLARFNKGIKNNHFIFLLVLNVVCMSNRYSGIHPWLITHYFTVCTTNGKYFWGKGGGGHFVG